MRCVSCGEDIPPQWVKAIETNTCPACGGGIMTEDARSLMDELADALQRMPNDPKGVAGWLLSNYRFTKIGTAEPAERFYGNNSAQQDNAPTGIKLANSEYDTFLERTNMANKVRTTSAQVTSAKTRSQKLAEMASNIVEEDEAYGNANNPVKEDDFSEEDIRTMNEYKSQGIDPFNVSNNSKPVVKRANANPRALSPEQISSMHQGHDSDLVNADVDGVARSNVGYNNDINDLSKEERELISRTGEDGRRVVMESRLKRIKAQEAVTLGSGSFSRSS